MINELNFPSISARHQSDFAVLDVVSFSCPFFLGNFWSVAPACWKDPNQRNLLLDLVVVTVGT